MIQQPQRSSFDLLRRLWTLIAPFRLQLSCLGAVVLLSIPLSLLTPVPLTLAVDSIIGSRPLPAPLQAWVPLSIQQSTTALFLLMSLAFIGIALIRTCGHRYVALPVLADPSVRPAAEKHLVCRPMIDGERHYSPAPKKSSARPEWSKLSDAKTMNIDASPITPWTGSRNTTPSRQWEAASTLCLA